MAGKRGGRQKLVSLKIEGIQDMQRRILALGGHLDTRKGKGGLTRDVLNHTIDGLYGTARLHITRRVNINEDYIDQKMHVKHADSRNLQASITAPGGRENQVRLARYDAQMRLVPKIHPQRSRSRGLLPISGGMKQNGVHVHVRRGAPKLGKKMFMLPLLAGNAHSGKYGVFLREGNRIKHLYAPSVHQLFGWLLDYEDFGAAETLQEYFINELDSAVSNIFKKGP